MKDNGLRMQRYGKSALTALLTLISIAYVFPVSHAVIIEDENEATGRVGLGCTVVVEDEKGNRTTYRITGSQEANPMEYKLSDDSPFGRAVVGKSVGDTFTVNAPSGTYSMKVVEVTREG